MKIIGYRMNRDIDVEFEDGYIAKNKGYKEFKNGGIKNPYYPEIYNIGYIGAGKYKPSVNKIHTKEYDCWHDMFKRCYDKKYHKKYPTYENCKVCSEWHNFQNFGDWFNENYYEADDEIMCLDKDILVKGNKIYSPETCIFVPIKINSLFTKRQNYRGKNPIGVHYHIKNKKFLSYCNIGIGSIKHLGTFDTELEAFEVYKNFKENYIRQVADEYKEKIPKKLYKAMYDWKVEIDD